MKISVVLTSYNHVRFVAEAIRSVLDQDYQDFEFIIRDDGSTDKTPEIILSFKDERIKYLGSGPNLGGAASLNECIKVARGEYIALINSDDVFLPHRLSTQLPILDQQTELGAVFSDAQIIDESGRVATDSNSAYRSIFGQKNRNRFDWLAHFFEHGNCLCHPSILIRRTIYEELGLYDPLLIRLPDFEMWVRLCSRYEIHIVPEPLLQFRLLNHEANTSGDNTHNRESLLYEYIHILSHFTKPEILNNLSKIFPELEDSSCLDTRDCILSLTTKALTIQRPSHQIFGLNLHRSLIQNNPDIQDIQRHLKLERAAKPFSSFPDFLTLRENYAQLLKKSSHWELSKEKVSNLTNSLTLAKAKASHLKNSIEQWNGRSWFYRIFHKFRTPGDPP
ncbi:hypothetical protein BH11VER1_BH11VER1_08620 [soil metagenome]